MDAYPKNWTPPLVKILMRWVKKMLTFDRTECHVEESYVCYKRCGQTSRSNVKIAQAFVCQNFHFDMDGWIVK